LASAKSLARAQAELDATENLRARLLERLRIDAPGVVEEALKLSLRQFESEERRYVSLVAKAQAIAGQASVAVGLVSSLIGGVLLREGKGLHHDSPRLLNTIVILVVLSLALGIVAVLVAAFSQRVSESRELNMDDILSPAELDAAHATHAEATAAARVDAAMLPHDTAATRLAEAAVMQPGDPAATPSAAVESTQPAEVGLAQPASLVIETAVTAAPPIVSSKATSSDKGVEALQRYRRFIIGHVWMVRDQLVRRHEKVARQVMVAQWMFWGFVLTSGLTGILLSSVAFSSTVNEEKKPNEQQAQRDRPDSIEGGSTSGGTSTITDDARGIGTTTATSSHDGTVEWRADSGERRAEPVGNDSGSP